MRNYLSFLTLLISFEIATAQQGIIRGTVIEDSNGEPLFGVTVQIKGTTDGAITDFDGKFEIKAAPGIYDLQISFVSFQTVTISSLSLKDGEVTLIDQIRLKEDVELLEEVVVTAEIIKTTEAALLTVKRKSANLIDGISVEGFRKIGDSDAASAAKRITGVSIEGGKYVYVRGLGDRYTKTLLNGMDIPGLDPDRNSLQMDIFPTNVLNNVIISKSFTANLPADFTGGLVNIETKDIPDIKNLSASVGFGFNPSMHFNRDYLTYEGGATDWLGFDDGTRKLHLSDNELFQINNPILLSDADRQTYINQLQGFNSQFGVVRGSSFMDFNFNFSYGDQKDISLGTLGYNFAISYKSNTEYYDNAEYNTFLVRQNEPALVLADSRNGAYGTNNVLLGGLIGVALKRDKAKYRFNFLNLQNGEAKAGEFDLIRTEEIGTDLIGISNNLEYSEKTLTNFFLSGEHYFNVWKLDWKLSPTISKISDPDVRNALYERIRNGAGDFTGELEISAGNTNFPVRIWRDLHETNYAGRIDVTRNHNLFGNSAKLMFGVGSTLKERDFIIRGFDWNIQQEDFAGGFDEIAANENLFPNQDGNFFQPQFLGGNVNEYNAASDLYSLFFSIEVKPVEKLNLTLGVRAEDYTQSYTGINQTGISLDNERVIDEFNLFPTGNLIFNLKENQNLRLAYTKTIARYSFKEASFIQYFDPLTDRTFIGALNPISDSQGNLLWDGDIRSTLIDNIDLRWEVFGQRGETISISTFYKQMNDPIEVVQLRSAASSKTFQPQNVGNANVYGLELEFKKSLNFITNSFKNIFISGNTTISESEITMTSQEFEARQAIARANEIVDNKRELQGQSPYIVNAGLAYDGFEQGLEIGVYYNVQGRTLTYTGGVNGFPDVYSVPFNSLGFSLIKILGKEDNMRLTFRVSNVLNDRREFEYESFGVLNEIFEARSPGSRISIGYRYEF